MSESGSESGRQTASSDTEARTNGAREGGATGGVRTPRQPRRRRERDHDAGGSGPPPGSAEEPEPGRPAGGAPEDPDIPTVHLKLPADETNASWREHALTRIEVLDDYVDQLVLDDEEQQEAAEIGQACASSPGGSAEHREGARRPAGGEIRELGPCRAGHVAHRRCRGLHPQGSATGPRCRAGARHPGSRQKSPRQGQRAARAGGGDQRSDARPGAAQDEGRRHDHGNRKAYSRRRFPGGQR